MENKIIKRAILIVLIIIAINFIDEQVIITIRNILTPLLIGFTIAYLLLPIINKTKFIINKLSNNKLKDSTVDNIAIITSEILMIAFILVLCAIILPELLTSIGSIFDTLPDRLDTAIKYVDNKLDGHNVLRKVIGNNSKELISNGKDYLLVNLKQNISNISTSLVISVTVVINYMINIIIGIFISIFTLSTRKQLSEQLKKILVAIFGVNTTKIILEETKSANNKFTGFFIGKIVDSLIIGAICLVFMLIMNMPYVGLVSFIIFLTNIVPIIGPFIGAIPSAILIFSISPEQSLYFIIFIFILQQLDGNYIGPKCIGSSVKLNTFYVLISLIIFGELMGIVGMIIGVPIFAVIYDIIKKVVYKRIGTENLNSLDS